MFARELQIATDVVGLVDEWAARFFEELDYINEGENGTKFAEQMRVDLPQVSDYSHVQTNLMIILLVLFFASTSAFSYTVLLFLARWLYQKLLRNILHGES